MLRICQRAGLFGDGTHCIVCSIMQVSKKPADQYSVSCSVLDAGGGRYSTVRDHRLALLSRQQPEAHHDAMPT
jgi:hypothetical protein